MVFELLFHGVQKAARFGEQTAPGGFPCGGGGWQHRWPGRVALGAILLLSAAHSCRKASIGVSIRAGKGNAPNLGVLGGLPGLAPCLCWETDQR